MLSLSANCHSVKRSLLYILLSERQRIPHIQCALYVLYPAPYDFQLMHYRTFRIVQPMILHLVVLWEMYYYPVLLELGPC